MSSVFLGEWVRSKILAQKILLSHLMLQALLPTQNAFAETQERSEKLKVEKQSEAKSPIVGMNLVPMSFGPKKLLYGAGIYAGFLNKKLFLHLDYLEHPKSSYADVHAIDLTMRQTFGETFFLQYGYYQAKSRDKVKVETRVQDGPSRETVRSTEEIEALKFGIGNRWQISKNLSLGCTWIGFTKPLKTSQKISPENSFNSNVSKTINNIKGQQRESQIFMLSTFFGVDF